MIDKSWQMISLESSVHEYIDSLVDYINRYSFLYRHSAIDFFVNDYWTTSFPAEWGILAESDYEIFLKIAAEGYIDVYTSYLHIYWKSSQPGQNHSRNTLRHHETYHSIDIH